MNRGDRIKLIDYKYKYLKYKKKYHDMKTGGLIKILKGGGLNDCKLCFQKKNCTKVGVDYICCSECFKHSGHGDHHTDKCRNVKRNIICEYCPFLKTGIGAHNEEESYYCCSSCVINKGATKTGLYIHDDLCENIGYCSFCGYHTPNKYQIICCNKCCYTKGEQHDELCGHTLDFKRDDLTESLDDFFKNVIDSKIFDFSVTPESSSSKIHIAPALQDLSIVPESSSSKKNYMAPALQNVSGSSCFSNSSLHLLNRMRDIVDKLIDNNFIKQIRNIAVKSQILSSENAIYHYLLLIKKMNVGNIHLINGDDDLGEEVNYRYIENYDRKHMFSSGGQEDAHEFLDKLYNMILTICSNNSVSNPLAEFYYKTITFGSNYKKGHVDYINKNDDIYDYLKENYDKYDSSKHSDIVKRIMNTKQTYLDHINQYDSYIKIQQKIMLYLDIIKDKECDDICNIKLDEKIIDTMISVLINLKYNDTPDFEKSDKRVRYTVDYNNIYCSYEKYIFNKYAVFKLNLSLNGKKREDFQTKIPFNTKLYIDENNTADYNLVGVVKHSGSSGDSGGGHYIAYINYGTWICYNDAVLTHIEEENKNTVVQKEGYSMMPYILLYERDDNKE